MKTIKNNLMKLNGVDKAYYIVSLIAATLLIMFAFLGVLNLIL